MPLLEREGRLHAVFIRRPETMNSHPGQVAFPGGKLDPGEDALAAALREAEEEVALPRAQVEPLGALHDVLVTSGFCMTPWVGRVPDVPLVPNPAEVARVFHVALDDLVDPTRTRHYVRPRRYGGVLFQIPYFEHDGELIWGATGRVVCDLLEVCGLVPQPGEAPDA